MARRSNKLGERLLLLRFVLVIVGAFCTLLTTAGAQAIYATGGVSTLMSASGFQLDYKWAPVQGWFGAGFGSGFEVGGYLQSRFHNYNLGLGDRYQEMELDTDIFDGSRYFAGRGLFVSRKGENQSWSAFGGATADERSYSFFRAFDIQQSTAAFFYERKLDKGRAAYHSINIVQDKFTSLHSIGFKLRQNWSISAGGGIGYNSRFLSAGSQYDSRRFGIQASFNSVGESFRRISGVSVNAPEHVGANIRLRYTVSRHLSFVADHENVFSPTTEIFAEPIRVSLDSVSAYAGLKEFHFGSAVSTSSSGALKTTTQNYSVSRAITRGLSASGSLMKMDSSYFNSKIYTATLQERFSPRLTLNGGVTTSKDMTSATFGGRFTSNRLTLGLQHDLMYSPLAGGFGGKRYSHVWMINLNVNIFRGIRLRTDSYIDPLGKMRYTAAVDGIGWSRNGEDIQGRGPTQPIPAFSKFVVKGIVRDDQGQPVWGINVQVDGQSAYTDSKGQFFMRFRRGETYPVSIVTERSLNQQVYEVVSAPVSALAELENEAQTIVIVVRRARGTREIPKKRKRSELDLPVPEPVETSGAIFAPETGNFPTLYQ